MEIIKGYDTAFCSSNTQGFTEKGIAFLLSIIEAGYYAPLIIGNVRAISLSECTFPIVESMARFSMKGIQVFKSNDTYSVWGLLKMKSHSFAWGIVALSRCSLCQHLPLAFSANEYFRSPELWALKHQEPVTRSNSSRHKPHVLPDAHHSEYSRLSTRSEVGAPRAGQSGVYRDRSNVSKEMTSITVH